MQKRNASQHRVLAYVAELELEVDRLRKHGQLLYEDAATAVHRINQLCDSAQTTTPLLTEIKSICSGTMESIRDLRIAPGYHPSHDQVVDIAFRPLVEKVFRWQQRVTRLPNAALHLELQDETLEWFPARLGHILNNLLANALGFCDPSKGEVRVTVGLRHDATGYELRVSDNGLGIDELVRSSLLDLSYRVNTTLARRPGVGLAVVQMLVEESGGSLSVTSLEGSGTSILVHLPRYDLDDFLTQGEQASAALAIDSPLPT
jgi:signal transduction histidine kinase